MALVKATIKTNIESLLADVVQNTDPAAAKSAFADALATIICDAVKAGVESAVYNSGLIAPPGTAGGPVTGTIVLQVTIS